MSSNAIVAENQKPGNPKSEWDLGGAGSSTIEGFTTRISVNRGSPIDFKINTTSANYRIDIYRLGWYGGLGARRVTTIQRSTASVQPAPIADQSIGLYDAGNWQVSASWAVPGDATSGVYVAKLVRQDGVAGVNHIPFIVRDDGSQHDIVFQTSDTTWHAYNGWGGANLYGGNSAGSPVDGRAFKVSYNRPFGTRDGIGRDAGPQDFLFSAEYPAIRWLERNGYDVCYISGVDTGPGNAQLTNSRVFMSTGHDEYWSGDQRAHVEAARDAGVHLIFISGNEVYWKTRWEPDANQTPNRTLVCYKESRQEEKLDPTPAWTGTWRDPTFSPPSDGGRPENALTGTIFQVDSHQEDIIQIPFAMSRYRFWRNTSVATIQPGQTASLAVGLLGYEWDESPDNGFRPSRMIHLSSTTVDVPHYLLDYGHTVGERTATHNLALYRAPSGALVFGAGTVFWSFGLDTVHDYSSSSQPPTLSPEDRNVQQAMVNLLADMGVQPQTLRASLTPATASTDTTPPISTVAAPANGANLVQQQKVTVSGTASDVGGVVAGVEVSTDDGRTWHPATGTTSWTYGWWPLLPGSYVIRSRAIDDSLNVETPTAAVTVTVTPAATVSLFTPTDRPFTVRDEDANPVELGVRFSVNTPGTVAGVRFYKTEDSTGAHVAHLWSGTGTLLATADFTNETPSGWQTATFPQPVTITPGSIYVASYHTNAFYAVRPNYFTTPRSSGALTAPANGNGVFAYGPPGVFPSSAFRASNYWTDVIFNRAGGAGNLPPTAGNDSGLIADFETPLVIPAPTLLANDTDPNGYPLSISAVSNPANGTVTFDAVAQIVTFIPAPGYAGPATFTYTITNGHGGTASATVSFTINSPTTTQTLFDPSDTPSMITVSDGNAVELGVKFRTAVAGTQVTGLKFYKGPQNDGEHVAHLWTSTGTLLATATFADESPDGWQKVSFPQPVTLTPNATYIASYHTGGFYSADANYFSTAQTRGALSTPASAHSGGNGVYKYGPAGTFPSSTFNANNYWVDIIAAIPTGIATQSLFGASDIPAILTVNDGKAVELGVKFQSSTGGQATGLKFYKGPQNTGTHVAHLWTATGTLLATALSAGETAAGWQNINFPQPVTLTANTTYIASYHCNGFYSVSANFFASAHSSGVLTAPSSAASVGNGVFAYGPAGSFPVSTFNANNYWVDVIVQAPTP